MLEKILINKNVRKEIENYIQSISEKEELEKAQSYLHEKYCISVGEKVGLIAGICTYISLVGGGAVLDLYTEGRFTSFIILPLTIGLLPASFCNIFVSSGTENIFNKYVYRLIKEKGLKLGCKIKYEPLPYASAGAGGFW